MNTSGIRLGTVVSIDDPAQMGRVRVRVPHVYGPVGDRTIADSDLPWAAPMGLPEGGSPLTGGLTWLPKPGDRVYVMFLDEEPEKPVWAYAMQETKQTRDFPLNTYGSRNKPTERGALTRYGHILEYLPTQVLLSTKKGYSLTLVDAGDTDLDGFITLQTPRLNMIEIDDSQDSLTVMINDTWYGYFLNLEFEGNDYFQLATSQWRVRSDDYLELYSVGQQAQYAETEWYVNTPLLKFDIKPVSGSGSGQGFVNVPDLFVFQGDDSGGLIGEFILKSSIITVEGGSATVDLTSTLDITAQASVSVAGATGVSIESTGGVIDVGGVKVQLNSAGTGMEGVVRLQDLQSVVNTIMTTFNAHTHGGVQGGPSFTSPPVTPLALIPTASVTVTAGA